MAARTKAGANPTETKLDDNVTEPSTVAPGDAPHDTTDPTEHASTVTPQPSAQALKEGTVNGTLKLDGPPVAESGDEDRIEEYDAVKPDGTVVRIRHNIDKATTEIVK